MTVILSSYQIEKVKEEMCDKYCKMPDEATDQEELNEFCKYCPLDKLKEENDEL